MNYSSHHSNHRHRAKIKDIKNTLQLKRSINLRATRYTGCRVSQESRQLEIP